MKIRMRWILSCLCIGVLLLLGGCNEQTLSTPRRVQIDPITLTLSWKASGGAAYYTVEITGNGETIERDSGKNSYSLERLEEGHYTLRVKAIAGSDGDLKDSGWSEKLTFDREKETGLVFALTEAADAFEVTGIGSASGEITVPDTYRGLPVTGIADRAFYNKSAVTRVVLGENIVSIGKQAFANCSYLTDAALPTDLRTIGDMAFQSCRVLETPVVFPQGVEVIGSQAFQYCRRLPSVTFTEHVREIGANAFDGCESLETVSIPDGVKTLGDAAFARCTALKNLTIGANVLAIGIDAFRQCTSLTEVTISGQVRSIGDYAFAGCTSLSAITMGDSVTDIGEAAFSGCTMLHNVKHVSKALTRIGKSAFEESSLYTNATGDLVYVGSWLLGNKSGDMRGKVIAEGTIGIADNALEKCQAFDDVLTLPDSVRYIGANAFANCSKMTGIILGSGVECIGNEAFLGCVALSGVYLGAYDDVSGGLGTSALTWIGDYAFGACSSLTGIEIPETVTHIGMHAFRDSGMYQNADRETYAGNWLVDCRNDGAYGTVAIRDGTVGIADYAFYNCKGLTGVLVPDSVRTIGKAAFYKCRSLESVTLPTGLAEIADYTFYYCSELTVPNFPVTLVRIGKSAFYKCRLVAEQDEGDENRLILPSSVKEIGDFAFYGCSYTYTDRATAEQKIGGMDILELGNGVTHIGMKAFASNPTLREVIFGSDVKTIGEKAFYQCTGLRTLSLNEGLRKIGDKAFYGCSSLASLSLPLSVTDIGAYTFYRCSALETVSLGCVERIGDASFLGCSGLQTLRFPDGLREIGKQAFRGCTGLSVLVLPETVENIGAHAFYGCSALTLFLEGKIVPTDYDERWNSSYRPIVLGVTVQDGVVQSFIWSNETVRNLNESNWLSDPERDGYRFVGWSATEGGTAEYTSKTVDRVSDNTRLFAVFALRGEE